MIQTKMMIMNESDECSDEEIEGEEVQHAVLPSTSQSNPLIRIGANVREIEVEDDMLDEEVINKKQKCSLCNKEFLRLKTHMTKIHKQ